MKTLTLKQKINNMKNISRDGKYEMLASECNLYGIAFFGHKGTKQQKDRLRYIWRMVMLYN
jgi:hypothetical protein